MLRSSSNIGFGSLASIIFFAFAGFAVADTRPGVRSDDRRPTELRRHNDADQPSPNREPGVVRPGENSPIVPGGLRRHEETRLTPEQRANLPRTQIPGHTLERHTEKSPDDLRARLAAQRNVNSASAFRTRADAERFASETIDQNRSRVENWLRDTSREPLEIKGSFRQSTGILVSRDRPDQVEQPNGAIVRLRKSDSYREGYFIITAYPSN